MTTNEKRILNNYEYLSKEEVKFSKLPTDERDDVLEVTFAELTDKVNSYNFSFEVKNAVLKFKTRVGKLQTKKQLLQFLTGTDEVLYIYIMYVYLVYLVLILFAAYSLFALYNPQVWRTPELNLSIKLIIINGQSAFACKVLGNLIIVNLLFKTKFYSISTHLLLISCDFYGLYFLVYIFY